MEGLQSAASAQRLKQTSSLRARGLSENTGLSLMRMKKRVGFDASCILETEVPTTVFGKGLNWYHQRVRSWEMGRHGRLLAFLDRFFFSFNGLTNPIAILAQKLILFYSIACIIVDWVRIPVIVTMGANGAYWRQAGSLSLVSIFPILWFKYVSCRRRPDLQPTFSRFRCTSSSATSSPSSAVFARSSSISEDTSACSRSSK